MNEERRDKIIKDHPNLFSYPLARYFECMDGWLNIIEDLANKPEPLIIKCKENNRPNDPDFLESDCCYWPCASQIKEKYGTLRFYMTCETDEMSDLIREAEKKTETTCENCGNPGSFRGKYWYYTRCDGAGTGSSRTVV